MQYVKKAGRFVWAVAEAECRLWWRAGAHCHGGGDHS